MGQNGLRVGQDRFKPFVEAPIVLRRLFDIHIEAAGFMQLALIQGILHGAEVGSNTPGLASACFYVMRVAKGIVLGECIMRHSCLGAILPSGPVIAASSSTHRIVFEPQAPGTLCICFR